MMNIIAFCINVRALGCKHSLLSARWAAAQSCSQYECGRQTGNNSDQARNENKLYRLIR